MTVRAHPDALNLPCGGLAVFDHGSGIRYRCTDCTAVVGSIGQPKHCQEAAEKYRMWQQLGGKGWDYLKGCEKQ